MSEEKRLYRMTPAQRHAYVAMLLWPGNESEALRFREECDAYWMNHPDEWDRVNTPADKPIPL